MKRLLEEKMASYRWIVTLLFLLIGCFPMRRESTYPLEWVELRVRHRLYPKYEEIHRVKPYEFFELSDTDYRARVIKFIPDFAIDDSGNVFSKSNELNNPAVLVEVWRGRKKVDEQWVFRKGSIPHFKRTSFIVFEIIELSQGKEETVKGEEAQ
jgi:hypothetical protein